MLRTLKVGLADVVLDPRILEILIIYEILKFRKSHGHNPCGGCGRKQAF